MLAQAEGLVALPCSLQHFAAASEAHRKQTGGAKDANALTSTDARLLLAMQARLSLRSRHQFYPRVLIVCLV